VYHCVKLEALAMHDCLSPHWLPVPTNTGFPEPFRFALTRFGITTLSFEGSKSECDSSKSR
jgi:hypothetical protein